MKKLICIGLLLLMVAHVQAQTTLFKNATVETMTSEGRLEHTDVLVKQGKIIAVGKNLKAAKKVKLVDATGKVLTPGLFQSYSHLGVVEISGVEESVDSSMKDVDQTPSFSIQRAINPDSSLIDITLMEGITHAITAPASGKGLIDGLGTIIQLGHKEQIIYQANRVVFMQLKQREGTRAATWWQIEKMLKLQASYKKNPNKAVEDNWFEWDSDDLDVINKVVNGKLVLMVAVDRKIDIINLLDVFSKTKARIVIQGGAEAWMVAEQLAKADIPVIVNPMDNLPSGFDRLNIRLDNAALLEKAGVKVAISNFETHNARNLPQFAGNAVANGMSYQGALAAITRTPAEIFGLSAEYGMIKKGMKADLVLWPGDPLEVSVFPEQVWVDGVAISMQSRQTKLRDRYWDQDKRRVRDYIY